MYDEAQSNSYKGSLSDYLWLERKDLGERFFEAVDEYLGVDELTDKIEGDA